MARPRTRRRYPRELNALLKMLDVQIQCPRCGQPGNLRVVARGYLAVRHGAKATHSVPPDLEAKVVDTLASRIAEAARSMLRAAEELRDAAQ